MSAIIDRLDEIEARANAAREPLHPDARMAAYYYSFDRTGCGPVDAVLSAVAIAGKGAHNTEDWTDANPFGYYSNRPGLASNPPFEGNRDEGSALTLIEHTAQESASKVAGALAATDALVAALRAVLDMHQPRWYSNGTKKVVICRACGDTPCATVRAIEEALS